MKARYGMTSVPHGQHRTTLGARVSLRKRKGKGKGETEGRETEIFLIFSLLVSFFFFFFILKGSGTQGNTEHPTDEYFTDRRENAFLISMIDKIVSD